MLPLTMRSRRWRLLSHRRRRHCHRNLHHLRSDHQRLQYRRHPNHHYHFRFGPTVCQRCITIETIVDVACHQLRFLHCQSANIEHKPYSMGNALTVTAATVMAAAATASAAAAAAGATETAQTTSTTPTFITRSTCGKIRTIMSAKTS